ATIGRQIFDRDIAAFDIAELLKALPDRAELAIIEVGAGQQTDQRYCSLLRPRRERPRSCSAAEQRDERAALHSITSSARCCKNKGTSTPMALAVWRLITSSNFVGCSTGRSAGFVPCKILCTNAALRRYICGTSAP